MEWPTGISIYVLNCLIDRQSRISPFDRQEFALRIIKEAHLSEHRYVNEWLGQQWRFNARIISDISIVSIYIQVYRALSLGLSQDLNPLRL